MQTRAETPEIIYRVLSQDLSFASLVGEYVFREGDTRVRSLSIITPGEPMDRLDRAEGLEVLIHDISEKERIATIGREAFVKHRWLVYMIAWPGATGATLDAASMRCMQLFSDATTVQVARTPSGLGALAQVLVVIPSTSVCSLDVPADIPVTGSTTQALPPTT
jgi:hypothetical protein